VAKPELGTKRQCADCNTKFYDLNRDPIICPKCGATFEFAAVASVKPEKAAPKPIEPDDEDIDEFETDDEDAELVPLEEADDEAIEMETSDGGDEPDVPEIDDGDIDVDVDSDEDDDAFLDEEDDDDDVDGILPDVGGDDDER